MYVDRPHLSWYHDAIYWNDTLGETMFEVITESGTVYRIDPVNGFWKRGDGPYERLKDLRIGAVKCHPTDDPKAWFHVSAPEVGKYMFVASRDSWWVTTKVVSVTEIEQS